jgi:integrase
MGVLGQPDARLFPGLDRDVSLPRNMYYVSFRKMAAEAGIDAQREHGRQRGVCPYCMRHTFACMSLLHLQKQGVIVDNVHPYLSAYMGHGGLYSTERYLKLVEPMMSSSLAGYEALVAPVYAGRAFDRDEVWE